MQETGGPILCNAKGHFITTLPGVAGLKHEAVIPLNEYTDGLHEFFLKGSKNTTAFIYYAALQVRATTSERAVKCVELPVFSPAILAKRNGVEWRLVAGDTISLEFDKSDNAVMWRPECPTETKDISLGIVYRFEGNK